MVPIDRKGRIVSAGEYHGWQVIVENDSEGSTGGYYVLIERDGVGYDDWVENRELLERYFALKGWQIEWAQE